MKRNKWLTYLILIALTLTIYSQQREFNKYDSRIVLAENKIVELFGHEKELHRKVAKLAMRQKMLGNGMVNLKNMIANIEEANEIIVDNIIVPTLKKTLNLVIDVVNSQKIIQDYVIENVDPKPAIDKLRLATVEVKVGKAGGTGTIIKIDENSLYILTAKHVVACKGKVGVQVTDNKIYKLVKILDISRDDVYVDKYVDMAIIKAPKPEGSFTTLDIAEERPTIGTQIYTMGHPIGLYYTVNEGIVSNYTKRIFGKNKRTYMMISAPAFSGNSGGACINSYNEIVGIVVGIAYVKEEGFFKDSKFYLPHLVFTVNADDINKFVEELDNAEKNSK